MLAALTHLKSLQPMATNASSAELRALMKGVERKAIFSARTNLANYVGDIKDAVASMLTGDSNMATAKLDLLNKLREYGYTPEEGFPGAPDKTIPPAEAGALLDLSSDQRLQLVVQTNFRQALNFQKQKDGNEPDALEQFPAWELVRVYEREIPRGERRGPKGSIVEVPGADWPSRFSQACDATGDTDAAAVLQSTDRMIARKDSPVWEYLGDPDNFDDAIGTDYPPFAFNSGYGWVEVARDECVELGLIGERDMIEPSEPEFGSELSEDETTSLLAELRTEKAELLKAAYAWRDQ